ncbi:MAG: class I SAM-dependent methyltransferase [Candidatus Microgenomates bacterium]
MKQVLSAYEQLGKKYLDYRLALKSDTYVKMFLRQLGKNSSVLDVGCGVGIPVDDLLIKAGHEVVGIDLSPSLIELARKNVTGASYHVQDMRNLRMGDYVVDGLVCLYAIFHIPRSEHKRMLETFASFLPTGGWMLISMGDRAYEGVHEMYGVVSYSSQWGSVENRRIVESAGFRIHFEEFATSNGERHQVIIARRIH